MREHQRKHARPRAALVLQPIRPFCRTFVALESHARPGFPATSLHGKEGVRGSSPREGFAELPANRAFGLSRQQTPVTRGHSRGRFDVRTLFARWTGIRLFKPFRVIRHPSLPRKASRASRVATSVLS